jgi:hypothetical protein
MDGASPETGRRVIQQGLVRFGRIDTLVTRAGRSGLTLRRVGPEEPSFVTAESDPRPRSRQRTTCASHVDGMLPAERKAAVRDPGTPRHPLWRTLRWVLAALAAWWLLWILVRGSPV